MSNQTTSQWAFRREGDHQQEVVASTTVGLRWLEDGVITADDQVTPAGQSVWTTVGDHPFWGQQVADSTLRHKDSDDEVDPDMTSMIDVVFQLIIFFMVAASLTVQKTLDSPHQKSEEQGATATETELKDENVFVVLSADGTVKVNDEAITTDNYDTLVDILKNAINEMDNSEMVLDAPDNVKHEYVVAVLDAAAGAEVDKVLFVSRPDSGDAASAD